MVRVAVEHGRDFIVDITLNLGRIEIVDLRGLEIRISDGELRGRSNQAPVAHHDKSIDTDIKSGSHD